MKCPFCGHMEDKVIASRSVRDGEATRRRRECLDCGRRFTTYEQIEEHQLLVVKRDGRRERFDRHKLLNGLRMACQKRPVSDDQLQELVDEVEREAVDTGKTELESLSLGDMVMHRLQKLDAVAYVRFASVYKKFHNAEEFKELVNWMAQN